MFRPLFVAIALGMVALACAGCSNPEESGSEIASTGGGGDPAPTGCGRMNAGTALGENDSLASCDGRFTLIMQGDGNLVLYMNGVGALWASNTVGPYKKFALMQGDGNLVV